MRRIVRRVLAGFACGGAVAGAAFNNWPVFASSLWIAVLLSTWGPD